MATIENTPPELGHINSDPGSCRLGVASFLLYKGIFKFILCIFMLTHFTEVVQHKKTFKLKAFERISKDLNFLIFYLASISKLSSEELLSTLELINVRLERACQGNFYIELISLYMSCSLGVGLRDKIPFQNSEMPARPIE